MWGKARIRPNNLPHTQSGFPVFSRTPSSWAAMAVPSASTLPPKDFVLQANKIPEFLSNLVVLFFPQCNLYKSSSPHLLKKSQEVI